MRRFSARNKQASPRLRRDCFASLASDNAEGSAMTDIAADKVTIRELVENWAVWRDARLWDRFRTVWHADGRMMATWFQGSFEEFIKVNDEGWARGVRILHFLGGSCDRRLRRSRDRANQDDDFAARAGRGRDLRRGLHRPLLRFLREARRPLGIGAAPADLREGPARSGRSIGQARRSTRICSSASPKAIATSPICRPRSATRSRPTCPASRGRSSMRFTRAARAG